MKYIILLLAVFTSSAFGQTYDLYGNPRPLHNPRQNPQTFGQPQLPVISFPNAQGGERYYQGGQYLGESHRHPSGGRIWYPNPAVR